MEKIIIMIPLIVIIGFLGIAIGMYISSQIKCHIRQNIFNNNLKKYDEEKKDQNTAES